MRDKQRFWEGKMNKRRLLKLAKMLETDAENDTGIKFDLGNWGAPAGARRKFKDGKPTMDCGTSACAMGLACISGAFKRAGLSFYIDDGEGGDGEIRQFLVPTMPPPAGEVDPTTGFGAAEELFDINYDIAEWLFSPDRYPKRLRKGADGERAVAKRIRDFVAGIAIP